MLQRISKCDAITLCNGFWILENYVMVHYLLSVKRIQGYPEFLSYVYRVSIKGILLWANSLWQRKTQKRGLLVLLAPWSHLGIKSALKNKLKLLRERSLLNWMPHKVQIRANPYWTKNEVKCQVSPRKMWQKMKVRTWDTTSSSVYISRVQIFHCKPPKDRRLIRIAYYTNLYL